MARTQGTRASSTLGMPSVFQHKKLTPTPKWKLKRVLP